MAKGTRKRGAKAPSEPQEIEGEIISEDDQIIGEEGEGEVEGEGEQEPEQAIERVAYSFDKAKAEEAYKDAIAAAAAFARAQHNLPVATRAFATACYDVIQNLMPELTGLRRLLPREVATIAPVSGGSILPEEVLGFLKEKNIQPPHFRSPNPFQGIVQTLYVQGRSTVKQLALKPDVANRMIAEANMVDDGDDEGLSDEEVKEKEKRRRLADNTQQSKIAKWVLAAVDKGERNLITHNSRERGVAKWEEWQKDAGPEGGFGKTIAVVKTTAGRKSRAELEAEKNRREAAAEQLQQAEAIRKRREEDNQPQGEEVDWAAGEDDGEVEEGVRTIEGKVVETEEDLPPLEDGQEQIEQVEGEQVERTPEPTPTPTPEPERRWHPVLDTLRFAAEQLGDLRDVLPSTGELTFTFDGTFLVINGWVGVDSPVEVAKPVEPVEQVEQEPEPVRYPVEGGGYTYGRPHTPVTPVGVDSEIAGFKTTLDALQGNRQKSDKSDDTTTTTTAKRSHSRRARK